MPFLRYLVLAGTFMWLLFGKATAQVPDSDIVSGFEARKGKAVTALSRYTKQDTNRVVALINVIGTALINRQRQELLPYCEEAMAISRNINYAEGLTRCYIWKGHYFKGVMKKDTAHLYYDSSINMATGSVNEILLRCSADGHRGKAWIYYEQENYYTALNHFFLALKYYESRSKMTTMNFYTIISNIYSRVNDLPQAIVYAEKNTALAESDTAHAMKLQAWLSLAEIYIRSNQLKAAAVYLDKMIPFMPDPVELMVNSGYYMNKGLIHYQQAEYDSSIHYYLKAYEVATTSRHSLNKTTALFYLSKSSLKLGNLPAAKKYADENLQLAEKIGSKIGKINALLGLSDYYHSIADHAKAYNLLSNATALKDSLLLEANINQINTLAAVYESEKKEKEIIQLQTEKELQAVSVKRKSTLNTFFGASIIALLFFGYLGYVNLKKTQKIAKQEQELQKQKIIELEKDKQLLTIDAMLKGQEEERSRIAKELHDGIGSLLSGTKLSFMNVKDNLQLTTETKMQFERSLSMLDNTIGDLRKVAQNLMPEALVKFGLCDALADFCSSMQASSGINILFLHYGENRKLDSTTEIFIYRIIQELVNNAVKHGGGSKIIAQLTMTENRINITVEDNGKGFDKKELKVLQGSGIANINYRVQYLNGTSDIISSPGNGTSINIQLTV